MTDYLIRFEPVDDLSLASRNIRAVDDGDARKMAFSTIREHLADQLRDHGQIDLRGTAHILDSDGLEIFAIDFKQAVGVVR